MADQPSPRRRFQFRLRTLMIVVTLLAGVCGYVGWQVKIVRERRRLLDRVEAADKGIVVEETTPFLRRLLGDRSVLRFDLPMETSADERRRIHDIFPEAMIVGYRTIYVNGVSQAGPYS